MGDGLLTSCLVYFLSPFVSVCCRILRELDEKLVIGPEKCLTMKSKAFPKDAE